MQDYSLICKKVSSCLENQSIASIVHSYLSPQFYVACIAQSWDKKFTMEYIGTFVNELAAVEATLQTLIDQKFMYRHSHGSNSYQFLMNGAATIADLHYVCENWGLAFGLKWNFSIEIKDVPY